MSTIFQKPPNNYQYLVGVPNFVDFEDTEVTRTGIITETALQSLIISGNAVVQRGQMLGIRSLGRQTGAVGPKTLTIRINGTAIYSNSFTNPSNLQAWGLEMFALRQQNDLIGTVIMYPSLPLGAVETNGPIPECSYFELPNFNFAALSTLAFSVAIATAGETLSQKISQAYVF